MVDIRAIGALLLLVLAGCSWVKTTPDGEKVRVLEPTEVTSCKRIGKTIVTGKASVAGIKRNQARVSRELSTLARNGAAEIGGDTVVPIADVQGDSQVFAVFKCVDPLAVEEQTRR